MTEPDLQSEAEATQAVAGEQQASAGGFDVAKAKEIFHRLGPVGPMALAAGTLPLVGTAAVLFALGKTDMAVWLRGHEWGLILFISSYVLLSGAALSNTYAPSLAAGFAFGLVTGSVAAMISVTLASTIVYFAVRWVAGTRITDLVAEHPKWKAVQDALIGSGAGRTFGIVFLIRLSSSPFAVTNLVLGATRANPIACIAGTILGFAPRTVAAVAIGASLSEWDPSAKSKYLIIAGIVATVIVLAIISTIANQALAKIHNSSDEAPSKTVND